MFEDERPHGVGVAFGADGELAGGYADLMAGLRAMRIVTVAALDESNVHPVTVRPCKLSFLRAMASEAQLRLRFDEHEIHIGRLVRAMT